MCLDKDGYPVGSRREFGNVSNNESNVKVLQSIETSTGNNTTLFMARVFVSYNVIHVKLSS